MRGVRTEIIAELALAGEPRSVITDLYRHREFAEQDIETAVYFETTFLKAA